MRELEILGMNPTGRGAWHGFTVTETRPGVRQGWTRDGTYRHGGG
jgi:hypothetical protein